MDVDVAYVGRQTAGGATWGVAASGRWWMAMALAVLAADVVASTGHRGKIAPMPQRVLHGDALVRMSPRLLHDDVFRRLCAARQMIHERIEQPLTVRELARRAGFSSYHFLRLFQRAFGKTPHAYQTTLRLAQARDWLVRDGLSVTEACLRVGFSSLGSFSSSFARQYGSPPTAFRRRVWSFGSSRTEVAAFVPYCFLQRFGLGS